MEWFQSAVNNFISPNKTPSYRGVETRRQSSVDRSFRPPLNPTHSLVIDRGLINKPGENNCFLNSAVQILWHNDVFRRSFRLFEGHTCDGEPCIFCALKVLFTQFQHGNQAALPPDVLRIAMSNCYENLNKFQIGIMDDAAECFEKILEQIHFNFTGTHNMDSCSTKWCVSHQKFALATVEQTVCQCRAQSEPLPFVEFVHYITTSQIVNYQSSIIKKPERQSFALAVHAAGSSVEDLRCQNYPKCKRNPFMRRVLLNEPDIICIGFIWDSGSPPVSYIMNVVEAIDTKIHPAMLFDQVMSASMKNAEYHLTAMITYYGRHYSTYCYHSHKQHWIYFDDANFRKAGSWGNVVEECRKAHFQPLLLVYSNPHGKPIDASKAPVDVTLATAEEPTLTSTVVSSTVSPSSPTSTQSGYVNVPSHSGYVTVGNNQQSSHSPEDQILYDDVRGSNHQQCSSHETSGHVTASQSHSSSVESQPLYDNVVSGKGRPVFHKQGVIPDMIEFSLNPNAVTDNSSATTSTGHVTTHTGHVTTPTSRVTTPTSRMTTPTSRVTTPTSRVTTPTGHVTSPTSRVTSPTSHVTSNQGIRGNPFMVQDSNVKPYNTTPSQNIEDVKSYNTTPSSQNKGETSNKVVVAPQSRKPPIISSTSGNSQNVTSSNPDSKETDPNPLKRNARSLQPPPSSGATCRSNLDTNIRGLPKSIRDSILHSGLCMQKMSLISRDPVMSAVLLGSAIDHIHGVVNHPSVTACPELQKHLRVKKESLQKKLNGLIPELDTARHSPLSLQSILSVEEDANVINHTKRSSGVILECIECKNRRFCDDTLICGPCRLKLKLKK